MVGDLALTRSTTDHAPEVQFDAWRQIVADVFVPATLSRDSPANAGFSSRVDARRVGDLTVAWLRSQPQEVERTHAQAQTGGAGVYFLNLPLSGAGRATQHGRTAVAGPGDFVLVDADRAFRLGFDRPFGQISVAIPKPCLDPLLADADACTAVTVSGTAGLGALASGALRALARQPGRLSTRDVRAVLDHVLPLIALAVAAEASRSTTGRQRLVQAAFEEVETSLDDPDLTAEVVARRLHVSASYVAKLFAERGTSFGRLVLARRLERAWALLDPILGAASITAVAHACGFRDSAHFARVFRVRFGVTPSQRRAGAGG